VTVRATPPARLVWWPHTSITVMTHADENLMKEWETSRELLKDFDKRLHDLRKYGFTFVTVLLALEGFLIPATNATAMDPLVEWTVIAVNLLLIVSMRLIDRNYQVFQAAAATRALVLERFLNLELTEIISDRYAERGVAWYVTGVYCLLAAGVMFLGGAALGAGEVSALIWTSVGVAVVLAAIGCTVRVEFPNGQMDWTLESVDCTKGDTVGITVTNLSGKKRFVFTAPDTMWNVTSEESGKVVSKMEIKSDLIANPHDCCTWLLNTATWDPGIYTVRRAVKRDKKFNLEPLARKLRVRERKPPQLSTSA